jgi:hypothetical protein
MEASSSTPLVAAEPPPRAAPRAPPPARGWVSEALQKSLSSRYMRASLVYLAYASLIMYVNLSLNPTANAVYSDDYYYSATDDGQGG